MLRGRLAEITGFARLSAVAVLAREAHRCGEGVAWVSAVESLFFPPDLARWGVAVERIPIVFAAERTARAAEMLMRTGAFALLVLDLGNARPAMGSLGRLLRLAGIHDVAVVALTEGEPSLGSLVGVRVNASHSGPIEGRLELDITAIKDKHRRPYWHVREVCCAPDGMY